MIPYDTTPMVRECTAPYQYMDPKTGELTTKDIRVRYFSRTTAAAKKATAEAKARAEEDPDAIIWLSDRLAERLAGLPDNAGPDGKEMQITVENLDGIIIENLKAIEKAIDDDLTPKEQPSK